MQDTKNNTKDNTKLKYGEKYFPYWLEKVGSALNMSIGSVQYNHAHKKAKRHVEVMAKIAELKQEYEKEQEEMKKLAREVLNAD